MKGKLDKKSCRPVSILNGFSKVYQRFISDSMPHIIQTFLSDFVSVYKKNRVNRVLISLIEDFKKNFDHDKIVGTVFMD